MNSVSLLPYYTAQSSSRTNMFNTRMGKLQRQLLKGDYDMFKYAPMFESDFMQITKKGEVIDVHNHIQMVTVAIVCTSPIFPIPDIMLLARPVARYEEHAGRGKATKGRNRKVAKTLELTRLFPLKFVKISVHHRENQQLRLKFVTGRSCYLQLCPLKAQEDLFIYWEKIIYLLRPPVDSNSGTYAVPAEDMICMPAVEEDRTSLAAAEFQVPGDQDQVSIRSLLTVSEVTGATSAAYAGGKGILDDSHKPTTMPSVSTAKAKSTELAKESATEATAEAVIAGAATSTIAGAFSLSASKSAGTGQVSAALAGAARGTGQTKTNMAIAGTANTSPKGIKVAVAGAASKSSESISRLSSSLSPEDVNVMFAEAESSPKTVRERGKDPAADPLVSALPKESHMSGQARKQRVSQASTDARKERRDKKEKNRDVGKGSHHRRAGERRRKAEGNKMAPKSSSQSSSSHRATRDDRKEKGCSSPGSGRCGSPKGVSQKRLSKELRISHNSGRSLSMTSSGSTSKRSSTIGSFLRNIKTNLTAKSVAARHGKDADIVTKTIEESTMEDIVMVTKNNQGVLIDSAT
ncbi:PREDICTED: protein FAM71A [Galeopterus variegatus]|uniref:Protein FAM71A n=1 Tax=Galeopterus variegatus TaxID=482537 RepID=A0ABM0S5S6_GALVR|nr:PREDICTED: protein FAM71A [Galeopterus variegatus]